MKVCTKCGRQAERGNFCPHCGGALRQEEQPTPVPEKPKSSKAGTIVIIVLCVLIVALLAGIGVLALKDGGLFGKESAGTSQNRKDEDEDETEERRHNPDPTQVTEAPVVVTEPAPVTEPDRVQFGIGSSGSSLVTARGAAFFFRDGSLVRVAKGEEKVLCDAPALNESLCTDGRQILYINDACVLTAVDAVSGEDQALLATGAYDTVVGATDSVIYLGHQESEEDWWGCEVLAYDWEGNLLQSYGDGWDVYMREGYLILSTFRSDVSPMRSTVIAPDGQILMEDVLNWGIRYQEGAVWYLRLATEEYVYDQPYDLELWRLDGAGNRRIATLGTLTGSDSAGFNGNLATVYYGVNSMEEIRQEMFDLEGKPIDPESKLYTDIQELYVYGLDDQGKRYAVRDGQLYRQAEDGAYAPNITLSENGYIYVYAILEDWVFYDVYDTNTWETSGIQYIYAP